MIIADLDTLRLRLGSQSTKEDALLAHDLEVSKKWASDRVYQDHFDDPDVQEAILLMAARLNKRRHSPEGVSGWDDLGVVRIISRDPDIERLIEQHVDAGYVYGIG